MQVVAPFMIRVSGSVYIGGEFQPGHVELGGEGNRFNTGHCDDPVAVYMPMSYQIGGYTIFVPKSALTPIDIGFEDAMRLALTGAVTSNQEP